MSTSKKSPVKAPRLTKKTWREKLADDKDLPKVVMISPERKVSWGQGSCAIPRPRDVDALMRKIPRGSVATINELRRAVAKSHGADIGCPITTGIFSWIAAHAAAEDAAAGKTRITPYWRTLKAKGELNPKYPGGVAALAARLEAEGHTLIKKGQRVFVRDFEERLFAFD